MIRKCQQSDVDQVINIWLETSIVAHDFVDSEFWSSKVDDMRNIYIPSSKTFVYEEDETIKGFLSLHEETIVALFVLPSEQSSGVGKQLIAKSKEICARLKLTVYKENSKSIEFYKKCGFKVLKEQRDEHTGHPELEMSYESQTGAAGDA